MSQWSADTMLPMRERKPLAIRAPQPSTGADTIAAARPCGRVRRPLAIRTPAASTAAQNGQADTGIAINATLAPGSTITTQLAAPAECQAVEALPTVNQDTSVQDDELDSMSETSSTNRPSPLRQLLDQLGLTTFHETVSGLKRSAPASFDELQDAALHLLDFARGNAALRPLCARLVPDLRASWPRFIQGGRAHSLATLLVGLLQRDHQAFLNACVDPEFEDTDRFELFAADLNFLGYLYKTGIIRNAILQALLEGLFSRGHVDCIRGLAQLLPLVADELNEAQHDVFLHNLARLEQVSATHAEERVCDRLKEVITVLEAAWSPAGPKPGCSDQAVQHVAVACIRATQTAWMQDIGPGSSEQYSEQLGAAEAGLRQMVRDGEGAPGDGGGEATPPAGAAAAQTQPQNSPLLLWGLPLATGAVAVAAAVGWVLCKPGR